MTDGGWPEGWSHRLRFVVVIGALVAFGVGGVLIAVAVGASGQVGAELGVLALAGLAAVYAVVRKILGTY